MKELKRRIDSTYGKSNISVKEILIIIFILGIIDILFAFEAFQTSDVMVKILYGYISFLMSSEILMFIAGYFHGRKKNAEKFKRCKMYFMYITLALFGIFIFPILSIFTVLEALGIHIKVEDAFNYLIMILMETSYYLIGVLACILTNKVIEFEFHEYLIFVFTVYSIFCVIRGVINKILFFGSHKNQYNYRYQLITSRKYFINIISVVSGAAGLFIARYGNEGMYYIYAIMPAVIFSGLEQIRMTHISVIEEKSIYLKEIYEELLILRNISIRQIENDFNKNIIVKIKLSSEYYTIECYKNYLLKQHATVIWGLGDRKRNLIEKALDEIKKLVLKEYKLYEPDGEENLVSDIEKAIEGLAECILELYEPKVVAVLKDIILGHIVKKG